MTTLVEERPKVGQVESRRAAYGLTLRLDPRIPIEGLGGDLGEASTQTPTCIRLDPDELDRRWQESASSPMRVRERWFGGKLLLSVDFADPAGYLLWVRDFGRVLISPDGLKLLCDPDPVNTEWAVILSAQALPLAATIRGFEVIHASGVVLDGRALLITGPSGAGKSSLGAALVRIGGRLLSDDAVAVELSAGTLVAHPGSLALQLRVEEDERLSPEELATLGTPVGFVDGKRRYAGHATPVAAPLGGVFLLSRSMEEPAVERVREVDPFELIANTFNLSVRTPDRLRRQLDVVSAIASKELVHRLRVQPGVDATRLAAIVQEYLAGMDDAEQPQASGDCGAHKSPPEL